MIVSRVLYALPAWGGFLSSDLLNRIDSILRKAHKFGYTCTTEVLKVTDMLQNADNKLFSLMFRSSHCLHTLLPDLKAIDIVLRNSGTCLIAVINCTNSHLSIYVFFATAIDTFCSVGHICYLIWPDLIRYHFSPHNSMAFVRLNKRHVMFIDLLSAGVQFDFRITQRIRTCTKSTIDQHVENSFRSALLSGLVLYTDYHV